jgi:hypothetical protein
MAHFMKHVYDCAFYETRMIVHFMKHVYDCAFYETRV